MVLKYKSRSYPIEDIPDEIVNNPLVYFGEKDFNHAYPPCTLADMDIVFLKKLDVLRRRCGFPFQVSCAFRSTDWDKKHNRSGGSYHCKGRACDILYHSSGELFQIVTEAKFCGINGIGIYPRFVHLDDRDAGTMWYGVQTDKNLG